MDKKLSIFLCSINLSLLLLYLKLKILTLPVYFGVAWLQQLLLCGGAFSRKQNLLHAFWGFFFGVCWGDARGRCYQNILILAASHIIQIKP